MKISSIAAVGILTLPMLLSGYAEGPITGPAPETMTVTAYDYSFEAPYWVSAGPVTVRLINRGKEFHHIWLLRVDHGKTAADLVQALKGGYGSLPVWAREVGGPNAPAPGAEAS